MVSFHDGSQLHPPTQLETFTSPPVPLTSFPSDRNIFVEFGVHAPLNNVFFDWGFRYYPDTTCSGAVGWSPILPNDLAVYFLPGCGVLRYFATDSTGGGPPPVPAGVDSVSFVFSVVAQDTGSFTPLLDNVWIGVSSGAVLHVPSPTYPTIESAITTAAPGDTILVGDGTYSGAGNCGIDFGGKDLVLVSESGASLTVVDCLEADRGLIFQSGETSASVVDGFTFTGGDSTIGGSAIRIGAASPTISNCVVTGNSAQFPDSGVVLIEAGAPTFYEVEISNNGANGGVTVVTGGTPAVTNCDISSNQGTGVVADPVGATFTSTTISANVGGGVHLRGTASSPGPFRADTCLTRPTFTGCIISGNTTTASGGGILIDPVTFCVYSPVFSGCVITGNSASGNGGGVALLGTVWDGATAPDFDLCTIAGNSAGGSGGAIYSSAFDAAALGQGIVYADDAIVWDNCASGGGGGQIHIDTDNQLFLSCALADTSGGAIQGDGAITLTSVSAESPGFCTASLCGDAPTVGGDFGVTEGSPALAGEAGNPCGVPLGAFTVACTTTVTGASAVATAPARTTLHAPRPNPFGTATEIRFDLARPGPATVSVYDVAGRRVATLARGQHRAAAHRVFWDGRDDEGRVTATGVYFVRLVAGEDSETHRIVRLR